MIEDQLKILLAKSVKALFDLEIKPEEVEISIPKHANQGDFSSNLAMKLAKSLHQNPRQIAQSLAGQIEKEIEDNHSDLSIDIDINHIEIAGPGFLNFFLEKQALSSVISKILKEKENYGKGPEKDKRILLEYVSANPTGSLHLGHARGAAWGDSLARILRKAGYRADREYYINDAGAQIDHLAESLKARFLEAHGKTGAEIEIGADGYLGEDIKEKGKELAAKYPVEKALDFNFFKKEGIDFEMDKIKKDLKEYRVEFDYWSSEQSLRDQHLLEAALQKLDEKGLIYEDEGALWFKSSAFGDDKDRVLKKKDGLYTYLMPDIAYHDQKYNRGYDQLVNLFGADHHGYIKRLKASMQALGHDPDKLDVDIIQMVRLVEGQKEVKMSKRLGNATTIKELIDLVGVDAARYFFVERALNSHLDFDLQLAQSKSNENPVYYAQYAHARMHSILENVPEGIEIADSFEQLTDPKEIELLKILQSYPGQIEGMAAARAVHRLPQYIQKLAGAFHSFYNACKVIDKNNPKLSSQRLGLVKASQIVLADALSLLGIAAPDHM